MEHTPESGVEDQYTEAEWAELFNALELPESDEIKLRLRNIAMMYQSFAKIEPELPTRKEERFALTQLQKHATAIANHAAAIEALSIGPRLVFNRIGAPILASPIMSKLTDLHLAHLVDEFKELSVAAETHANAIPKPGPTPKKARYHFVLELAKTYRDFKPRGPTRVYDEGQGGESGPFYKLVLAALKPLDATAWQGVASDIRKVLRDLKRHTPESV